MFSLLLNASQKVDINRAVSDSGRTPLILAAYSAHLPVCRCLVEHGANVNSIDHQGRSALWWASCKFSSSILPLFSSPPSTHSPHILTYINLVLSSFFTDMGHVEIIRYLLETASADHTQTNADGTVSNSTLHTNEQIHPHPRIHALTYPGPSPTLTHFTILSPSRTRSTLTPFI